MFLHQVEVKEWLNSCSSCAKDNLQSVLDPKRLFQETQQTRDFWRYNLMEIDDFEYYRLLQAAFAG
ncbi:hypothetical protein BB497_11625 [Halomonas sp. GFAJ-1]|nr:hypothetical protein BB497_11625 [Halomonas sp. GFAJ-1]